MFNTTRNPKADTAPTGRRRRRWMPVLSIVAVLALVAAACGDDGDSNEGSGGGTANTPPPAEGLSGDPIKIGVLVDRSGVVVFSSEQMVEGLEASISAINSGELFWGAEATSGTPGILDRPIELVFADTQANPNQALVATRSLVSQGVSAIIGTTTSPDAIQAKVACQEAEVPCIFPTVSAAEIVTPPNADFAFTMAPSFDVQAAELVNALQAAGHENVAIVVDDTGAAATLAESFVNAFDEADFPVVATETVPASAQDVTSQVARLQSTGADAVLDLIVPSTLNALFVRQFKEADLGSELFAINPLVTQPQIPKDIGEVIDGTVVIDQMDRSSDPVAAFTTYFQELHGDDTEVISSHLYMATTLLALKAAMEAADSTEGPAVVEQLVALDPFPAGVGTPGYTFDWTEDDHNGSGPGGVVFVIFNGLDIETWSVYQPTA